MKITFKRAIVSSIFTLSTTSMENSLVFRIKAFSKLILSESPFLCFETGKKRSDRNFKQI